VHRRPGGERRLATAVKAFVGVRPALQQRCAPAATGGADKPLWPTPLEQERRATPLVRKARLKLAQRSRPSHPMSPPPDADRRRTAPSYYILTNLGQRDEPVGLPFALWIDYRFSPSIDKLALPSVLSAALYVYLFFAGLFIFRGIFTYSRWVFPKIEIQSEASPPLRHRVAWLGIMIAVFGAAIWDAVKAFW